MYNIKKCKKIKLSQGAIYLGPSDQKRSVGYLELNPHSSLSLHNRPAQEQLTQIKGQCNIVIFNNNKGETNILKQGNIITISPSIWHIHTNPYNEISLTYWDFDGDIRKIINDIKREIR
jgi:quercetin dioxygenase-like cupin family protein